MIGIKASCARPEIGRILEKRGLDYIRKFVMKDKHDIVYDKFATNEGDFYVKYDSEYFRKFGEFYPEFKCKLGDSFCAGVIEKMHPEDTMIFVKPDGIYEVSYSSFMAKAKKRKDMGGNQMTWTIPRDMFRRLQ